MRIAHHDGSLCSPKHTRAQTQDCAGKDDEAFILVVVVAEVAGDVQDVAQSTQAERQLDTQPVHDRAGKEAKGSKGAVDCDIGIVTGLRIELATPAEPVHSVEHARAEEADEGDERELDGWGGIMGDGEWANASALVLQARVVACDEIARGRLMSRAVLTWDGGGDLRFAGRVLLCYCGSHGWSREIAQTERKGENGGPGNEAREEEVEEIDMPLSGTRMLSLVTIRSRMCRLNGRGDSVVGLGGGARKGRP